MINEIVTSPSNDALKYQKRINGNDGDGHRSDNKDSSSNIFHNNKTRFFNTILKQNLTDATRLLSTSPEDDSLYKCVSKDSLSSLQNLADSHNSNISIKKYLIQDHSSYNLHSLSSFPSSHAYSSINQTNFLAPRKKFTGYQISGFKKYQVNVTINTINLPNLNEHTVVTEPHITGFLTIKGLTNNHPEISTFFESFVVTDNNFGFMSSSWGNLDQLENFKSNNEIDMEHWLNFPQFKKISLMSNNSNYIPNYINQRYIFMRWKEKFLIPDAFINNVEGASYDGFYYIVHDQILGTFQGFYYHKDAEKFQQLELVPIQSNTKNDCSFEFA
ncbi:hypothetical protein KAFR_0D02740 [Kazachstania africana CBS 2517]|uniref:Vacuolar import and degradation protein 24 n=1 Tax=Kazachstania africana (strain ATCC 22294 / BCRC 22015 / CBS 2517 / CECT 1963 / NBRC 1671 / NRRL Y-8276) TaxID=1071382 RepID=H2AU72_KAZAF|nr:hypothetical protein KAFR_0D02740 [Kazachstania africana CBS 2517]CCF57922.1 hypothetical protein KAFR_0D02740 [Kazachstania africana CBS 2517]